MHLITPMPCLHFVAAPSRRSRLRRGYRPPWPGRLGAPSAGLQLRVGARGPGSSSAATSRRPAAGEASPHGRRRFPSPSSIFAREAQGRRRGIDSCPFLNDRWDRLEPVDPHVSQPGDAAVFMSSGGSSFWYRVK